MKFIIDDMIFEKFENVQIGVIVCKNILNTYSTHYDEFDGLLKDIEAKVKEQFTDKVVHENEKIAIWREVYTAFGAKPKKYKCSIENLCNMILSGITIRRINPLVDLYNYISLKYLLPVGGDDLDKVEGDIQLTVSDGTETYYVLNGAEKECSNPKFNEVIYKDKVEVLCRRWNWRECDKTKFTDNTSNAVIFVEGVKIFDESNMQNILDDLSALISKYCGGENIQTCVLNSQNKEINLLP